jgi:hypothetical protein
VQAKDGGNGAKSQIPMKPLPTEKRAQILYALCEGMSIRGTSRMFSVSTNTVLDLLARVGEACSGYQDENIRGLKCAFVEMDEIHSFIAKKGDAIWCWVALDRLSKLRITWHIGDRSARSANAFCYDLSKSGSIGARNSPAMGCQLTVGLWRATCQTTTLRSW